MKTFIVLAGLALALLLLLMLLIKMLFSDLLHIALAIASLFFKSVRRHEGKSDSKDYEKVFHYLLKRASLTQGDFAEERAFFVSLINKAMTVEQLKVFVENISYFCEHKLDQVPKFKKEELRTDYVTNYSEMVYFIKEQTKSRFEIIQQLDEVNSFSEFVALIDQCFNEPAIDMVLEFANKLQFAEYKKLEQIAEKRREYVAIRTGQKRKETVITKKPRVTRRLTLLGLVYMIMRYVIVGYTGILAASFFMATLLPTIDVQQNSYLLVITKELRKAHFLPRQVKPAPYYIKDSKVYFIVK